MTTARCVGSRINAGSGPPSPAPWKTAEEARAAVAQIRGVRLQSEVSDENENGVAGG